jgi:putative phosphoesterase
MNIGLLSDTHSFIDPQIFKYFENCDEIWHAGDWGTYDCVEQLQAFKPLVSVYGNIDGQDVRASFPKYQCIERENFKISLFHIGGKPGYYPLEALHHLQRDKPQIWVCGHSHILRVSHDKKYHNVLHLNPGAAGKYGDHHVRTLLRFSLNDGKINNMQAIELGKRV